MICKLLYILYGDVNDGGGAQGGVWWRAQAGLQARPHLHQLQGESIRWHVNKPAQCSYHHQIVIWICQTQQNYQQIARLQGV